MASNDILVVHLPEQIPLLTSSSPDNAHVSCRARAPLSAGGRGDLARRIASGGTAFVPASTAPAVRRPPPARSHVTAPARRQGAAKRIAASRVPAPAASRGCTWALATMTAARMREILGRTQAPAREGRWQAAKPASRMPRRGIRTMI